MHSAYNSMGSLSTQKMMEQNGGLFWEALLPCMCALHILQIRVTAKEFNDAKKCRPHADLYFFSLRQMRCETDPIEPRHVNIFTFPCAQPEGLRIDFLGLAEAVQPSIHFCAHTDQDHRAAVMEFSNYRPAICDLQLLAQESVQCLLQQWWLATPLLPTGLTPNQGEALLAKWMRHGLRCVAPQSKQ